MITYLPQFCQMDLQRLRVLFEPQRNHRVQNILPTDRLPFLHLTLLSSFGRDEADVLRNAFLHAFFGFFGDFGGRGDGGFHYARDVCDLTQV